MIPAAWNHDGWPLCPVCGEDELGCLKDKPSISMALAEAKNEHDYIDYLLSFALFCYQCGRETVLAGEAKRRCCVEP